jgi:hypothetical protein
VTAVTVPEEVTFPAPIVPTVILGVPIRLDAGVPVRFAPEPLKLVAVTIPVISAPLGKLGAPVPALLVYCSALIFDIILETFYLFIGSSMGII